MSAWTELLAALLPGETIEAISFGAWGWGSGPDADGTWESGYGEPDGPPIPFALRGVPLSPVEAEPLMQSWNIAGGYGAPECYALNVWTTRRVLWITQYDGATHLSSAPRHPSPDLPEMPGG